jgi:hypothetical protein
MSVITSKPKEIWGNPSNNSPTKQLYTFNKDSRFKKPLSYNPNMYYQEKTLFNKPEIKDKEKTSFGVPARPHIWVNKELRSKVGPNYTLPSAFAPRTYAFEKRTASASSNASRNAKSSPVGTFGVSRDKYAKVVGFNNWSHQPHDRCYPGPGEYTDRRKEKKH